MPRGRPQQPRRSRFDEVHQCRSTGAALRAVEWRAGFHGARVGGSLPWVGSPRRLGLAASVGPSAHVYSDPQLFNALRPLIMRFDPSKSSQISIINSSNRVYLRQTFAKSVNKFTGITQKFAQIYDKL